MRQLYASALHWMAVAEKADAQTYSPLLRQQPKMSNPPFAVLGWSTQAM
jgi:hypothetical protein